MLARIVCGSWLLFFLQPAAMSSRVQDTNISSFFMVAEVLAVELFAGYVISFAVADDNDMSVFNDFVEVVVLLFFV